MTNQSHLDANKDRRSTDWRATIFHLLERWGSQNRMPTQEEWNVWTRAVHEASVARANSNWAGEDPIFEEGYEEGFSDAMNQVEEEACEHPAGRYPYA